MIAPLATAPSATLPAVETRLLEGGGMRLNVATTAGEPGFTPLVLFNGIGANLELLEPFVAALDPRIPTVRIDAPGIGHSPRRLRPYRFRGLARAVGEICDQLGHRGALDVFGISWGGAAAQAFTRYHRHRARRLILAATSMGAAMVPASPRVLLRMVSPARYLNPNYLTEIAPQIYGGDLRQKPHLLREFAGKIRGTTLLGYLQQLIAGIGWTSLWWIWRMRQPVLVMAGSDDPLVPHVNARLMARLIPKSRLVTYDCGHLFLLTRLQQVAPEVNAFLLNEDPLAGPG
ncbi:MAG: poly(3-hydroxyalkanoate) depolymerase [Verrucomicrobia bacterium]|nr:poly(3-hydroxyalkanoate) depolymerase [Verrucomicrobiota bacterium]